MSKPFRYNILVELVLFYCAILDYLSYYKIKNITLFYPVKEKKDFYDKKRQKKQK